MKSRCVCPSQATNCGIVESILNWVKFKAQTQLNKKCSSVKHSKIKGIPKLDDANDAGVSTVHSEKLMCRFSERAIAHEKEPSDMHSITLWCFRPSSERTRSAEWGKNNLFPVVWKKMNMDEVRFYISPRKYQTPLCPLDGARSLNFHDI